MHTKYEQSLKFRISYRFRLFLQNNSSELNQTDGFLSSILNDEDLQLMDMAMNEGKWLISGYANFFNKMRKQVLDIAVIR